MPPVYSLPLTLDGVRSLVANATSDAHQWNTYIAYAAAGIYAARQVSVAMGIGTGRGGSQTKKATITHNNNSHTAAVTCAPAVGVVGIGGTSDSKVELAAELSHLHHYHNHGRAKSLVSIDGGEGIDNVSGSGIVGGAGQVARTHSTRRSFTNMHHRQRSFGDLRRASMAALDSITSPTQSRTGQPGSFPRSLSMSNVGVTQSASAVKKHVDASDDLDNEVALTNEGGAGGGGALLLNAFGASVSKNVISGGAVGSPVSGVGGSVGGAVGAAVGVVGTNDKMADDGQIGFCESAAECEPAKKKDGTYPGFWSDVAFLLKVGFRGTLKGKEVLLLFSYISILLLRTIISTRIVFIDGEMLQAVIAKDKRALVRALTIWLLMGIPNAVINTLMKYLNQSFALALRTNINDYITKKYFSSRAYYKIAPVGGRKNHVPNVDQAVTDDVALWSGRLSNLMSFLGRPAFDMFFFSSMLFQNFGFWNQFAGMAASYEVGKLLHFVRPNFSEAIQVKGGLEADFRSAHSKIVAGAEEIAFSNGEGRERTMVQKAYEKLKGYTAAMYWQNFKYFSCEEYLTRYIWSSIGLLQVAFVAFSDQLPAAETAKRVVIMRRIMAKNGAATEKFMRGVKLIHEFAGVTSGLMAVFNALHSVEAAALASAERTELRTVGCCDATDLAVEDLVVATPSNEILIKSLTFRLRKGDRLLVLGPNGCGKSSLFRVLCGLWPQRGGKIHLPRSVSASTAAVAPAADGFLQTNSDNATNIDPNSLNNTAVFFLPQKPYVMRGTLREQLHYPDPCLREGLTDDDLMEIVDSVKLRYLVEHAGGLGTVEDWGEILSGGEKQRIGLARIFYHKPLYAVLDECSSAINADAEQAIFGRLVAAGTTLITISHRQTLQQYHNKLLIFDNEGGYRFEDNGAEKGQELSELKQKREALRSELGSVLKRLGEDWPAGPTDLVFEDDLDDDDLVEEEEE